MKREVVLAIFAHPDDESFGPGGTLALLSRKYDVILVSLTAGEACTLADGFCREMIADVRKTELLVAAKTLGIKQVKILQFPDGCLKQTHEGEIEKSLQKIIEETQPISMITFEPKGFSGHEDHIIVSKLVTELFEKNHLVESIHYFAITKMQRAFLSDYFVRIPEGYHPDRLDTLIDVSPVWQKKIKAIEAYQSQIHDQKFWRPMLEGYAKHEHFISKYRTDEKVEYRHLTLLTR